MAFPTAPVGWSLFCSANLLMSYIWFSASKYLVLSFVFFHCLLFWGDMFSCFYSCFTGVSGMKLNKYLVSSIIFTWTLQLGINKGWWEAFPLVISVTWPRHSRPFKWFYLFHPLIWGLSSLFSFLVTQVLFSFQPLSRNLFPAIGEILAFVISCKINRT